MNSPGETTEKTIWVAKTTKEINKITSGYSARERKNTRISFLLHAVEKVAAKENVEEKDWAEFQEKTAQIIRILPEKSTGEKLEYGKSLKVITRFKTYILKKFNYVSQNFFLKIDIFLGFVLGLAIGALAGYFLAGGLLGIGVGLVAGAYQDKKAKAAGRVL